MDPVERRRQHHAAVRRGLSDRCSASSSCSRPGSSRPARDAPGPWVGPIGFVAGFLDASGGGGWGPVATSSLVGSGHAPRLAVGSVNTTEFFVTIAAATTFFVELGASPWKELLALIAGGMLAAPLGGWAVKHIPARPLMILVGCLVIALSLWQIARAMKPVWREPHGEERR